MSKIKEIWQIVRRKDFKDGDEVHAVKMPDGSLLLSDSLYKTIKPELEKLPGTKHLGDSYGIKILSTRYLPYIYRDVAPNIKDKKG